MCSQHVIGLKNIYSLRQESLSYMPLFLFTLAEKLSAAQIDSKKQEEGSFYEFSPTFLSTHLSLHKVTLVIVVN